MPGAPGDIPPVPTSPVPPLDRIATVISLDRRRKEPDSVEPPTDPRRLELAVWLSSLFRQEGLSLADRDTALALHTATSAFRTLIDSALAVGILEQDPERIRAYIHAVLQDMDQSPDLI